VVKKEKAKVPQNIKLPKPKQESQYITYIVKSGDTLGKIAKMHHVTVADLKKWNNLKSDFIRENQKLKIKQ
jgi:peptidoglycan endopeptidase LytE